MAGELLELLDPLARVALFDRPSPGVSALRFLGGMALMTLGGDGSVRSTTLLSLVFCDVVPVCPG